MRALSGSPAAGLVLASTLLLTGCAKTPEVNEVYLRSDGFTLELEVDTCNAELEASADESATIVQVTVLARNDTNDDCLDSVFISLEEPLGERRVVDASSGEVFDVRAAED